MDRVERFWLGVSNAVSEFIINRVERGHAAAAGEDLATYRTRVYGDAGGVVSLIEQGKPVPPMSRVPAVRQRVPAVRQYVPVGAVMNFPGPPPRSLGEEAFQRYVAEEADRPARVLLGPDTLEKEFLYPSFTSGSKL